MFHYQVRLHSFDQQEYDLDDEKCFLRLLQDRSSLKDKERCNKMVTDSLAKESASLLQRLDQSLGCYAPKSGHVLPKLLLFDDSDAEDEVTEASFNRIYLNGCCSSRFFYLYN